MADTYRSGLTACFVACTVGRQKYEYVQLNAALHGKSNDTISRYSSQLKMQDTTDF